MKRGRSIYGVLLMLAMAAGCSRGTSEQPGKDIPPPPPGPGPAANAPGGYAVTEVTDGGSIAGTITVSGPVTKLPARKIAKDPQVCGTAQRESQKFIVNQAGAVRNAVVIVEGVKRGKAMPAAAQNAEIDQNKCEYSPHVQVMAVNTEIALRTVTRYCITSNFLKATTASSTSRSLFRARSTRRNSRRQALSMLNALSTDGCKVTSLSWTIRTMP